MKRITTIIVAGGSGSRMGSDTPKQFMLLGGMPVLMRTINAMKQSVNNCVNNFIVVLPESQIERWKELCLQYNFTIEHTVAIGGVNRFESVLSGLNLVDCADFVVIQDGVRPFCTERIMNEALTEATKSGAALPVVEVTDSLRQIVNNSSQIVNRADYRAVQTPQIFRAEVIKKAYEQPYNPLFTDDASVVESDGVLVSLTRGDVQNIKITTQTDMLLAEAILKTI